MTCRKFACSTKLRFLVWLARSWRVLKAILVDIVLIEREVPRHPFRSKIGSSPVTAWRICLRTLVGSEFIMSCIAALYLLVGLTALVAFTHLSAVSRVVAFGGLFGAASRSGVRRMLSSILFVGRLRLALGASPPWFETQGGGIPS